MTSINTFAKAFSVARPTHDNWHISTFNQDVTTVTTYNNLSTLTFDSRCLITGHYLDKSVSFITVTASANVPPQGKGFLLFKHDQMQMRLTIVTTDTFSAHLHLVCKWWQCVIQFIRIMPFARRTQRGTIPLSHDTWPTAKHILTRSVKVIYLSQYLQHLLWTSDILH